MILNVGEHLDLLGTCRCCRCGLWRATAHDIPCVPCQKRRGALYQRRREERTGGRTLADELQTPDLLRVLDRAGYKR